LLFDERYSRYFAGLDYSLRAWESGLSIACVSSARVTRMDGSRQRDGIAVVPFEHDCQLFIEIWLKSGRTRRLGGRVARAVHELERLAELSGTILRSLRRGWRESIVGSRACAARLFDEARQYPVLAEAFADLTGEIMFMG
jgi:GT2 family glycosyltransferase